jgi:hypothetical protein
MSIVVRFTAKPSMTGEMYDESVRRIQESGDWPPDGMDYHVAFTSGGSFMVSEIWDSREQLETFGERLMPLLAEAGIELAGEPEILEVHNTVKR